MYYIYKSFRKNKKLMQTYISLRKIFAQKNKIKPLEKKYNRHYAMEAILSL